MEKNCRPTKPRLLSQREYFLRSLSHQGGRPLVLFVPITKERTVFPEEPRRSTPSLANKGLDSIFLKQSHVVQAGLKPTMWPRMTLGL